MSDYSTTTHLHSAVVDCSDNVVFSPQFDDIYFSATDGIGESHYHFLEGNALPTRFPTWGKKTFTLAETGFGTGLNFLLTTTLWQQHAPKNSRLHYISAEKHPITPQQLHDIYTENHWLNETTLALLENYPPLSAGRYHLNINNTVTLTLLFGDALSQFLAYDFVADAWFLDGFAPAKNPDLWTQTLFDCMASHSRPQTTFATFTAASAVRKGLVQAGFDVQKGKGFGKKRERLLGTFIASDSTTAS